MTERKKIVRACTVPMSIKYFVEGMLPELCSRYEVVLLSSPGSELEDAVARYGVRGIAVPMERHISPWRDIVSLWRIFWTLRKERPAMVHSMTPKAGFLCMVAGWLAGVPVRVHTFTGLVFPTATGLQRRILMLTDTLTCACATHVIPEGEGVRDDLLRNGITRKPLRVLGHGNVRGIDLRQYSMREEVTALAGTIRKEDVFTFLFVGRIVRDKGINEMVAAFLRLNAEAPASRLLLVGWSEEGLDPVSDETRQAIDRHPCIEALGSKGGDELVACYAAADAYVFPSYREGFPNTVIEAGAMGLPCIVTDINGAREIISYLNPNFNLNLNLNPNVNLNLNLNDNVNSDIQIRDNGMVIPSKDEEALYEAMKRMLTDTEMRQRMAGNARRMIAERYEQGYVRRCLLDYYDEILGHRN